MSCIICDAEVSKYKCLVCREPYCSVICCKQHKENKCSPPPCAENVEEEKPSSLSTYRFPTEDTVAIEKLQLLEQSEGLRNCIRNPHLKAILKSLDSCDAPAQMLKNFMQEPIFIEYVEECLKVVAPEENKKKPDILEELLTS